MIVATSTLDLTGFVGAALQIMRGRANFAAEQMNEIFLEKMDIILSQPGSGRWYRSKKKDGTRHQASAPGEAPAPDRGTYRRSWGARVENGANVVYALVGTNLWTVFGRRLELGGSDSRGVYIAPRPHVAVAEQQTVAPFNRILDGIDR